MRAAEVGLGVYGLDAHQAHKPLRPLAIDTVPQQAQGTDDLPGAVAGVVQVDPVDKAHQRLVLWPGPGLVIDAETADLHQLGLAFDRNHRVPAVNQHGPAPARCGKSFFSASPAQP